MIDAFCIPSVDITGPELRQTMCFNSKNMCKPFFNCIKYLYAIDTDLGVRRERP